MNDLSELISHSIGGYSIGSILSALLTFLVCLIVVRLVMKLCARLLSRANHLNDRLQKLILSGLKALLYLLTVIITAEALGINTSSLTALMSVLTLGVTLAAEDILGNVAGGLVILFSHPFSLGDEIEVGGTTGTVREITLTHTKIETPDGQIVLHRCLPRRAGRSRADGVSFELRRKRHRIHHPLLDRGRKLLGYLLQNVRGAARHVRKARRRNDLRPPERTCGPGECQ